MTLGEKIKYFRKKKSITQAKLAELSDIHPVSIRKYETNKMQPQPSQLEKIAVALDVSYNALIGIENNGMRLETVGDLIGVIMVLYNAKVLEISGERMEDFMLDDTTVEIKFNPLLIPYLEIFYPSNGEKTEYDEEKDEHYEVPNTLSLKDTIINIRGHKILKDILEWEQLDYSYQLAINASNGKSLAKKLYETKQLFEIELQSFNDKLYVPD